MAYNRRDPILRPPMSASNPLAAFRTTALCRGLDEHAAAEVFRLAEPVSFVRGTRLVEQGDPSRGAYVLHTGEVEARVALPAGGENTVARIGAGEMFGEMALMDGGACSASVVAASNVDGWFIEREAFRALVAARNASALKMQRTLTRSLVERLGVLNASLVATPAPEDRAASAPPAGDVLAGVARRAKPSFAAQDFLAVLPFFQDFARDEIDAVVAGLSYLEVARGQWLFTSGQPAGAAFLVVRGAVEAIARVGSGGERERRMALLGPGTLVGYLSVLRGTPHGAGARAREAATLLEIPATAFMAQFEGSTRAAVKFQHAVHRALLQSLARSNSQLARLVTQAALKSDVGLATLGV